MKGIAIMVLVGMPVGVAQAGPLQAPPVKEYQAPKVTESELDSTFDDMYRGLRDERTGFTIYFGIDPPKDKKRAVRAPDSERAFFKMPSSGPCKFVAEWDGVRHVVKSRDNLDTKKSEPVDRKMPIPTRPASSMRIRGASC
jgi:hypothetical protein